MRFSQMRRNSVRVRVRVRVRLREKGYGLIGTIRKDKVPEIIRFKGKAPRPSRTVPKGTLQYAHNGTCDVHLYAWMDTAACYFIDTVHGPEKMCGVNRKAKRGGEVTNLVVPNAIGDYNKHMGGVDTFDQLRTSRYALEEGRRTQKWTTRYFECLLSSIIANSYLIHVRTSNASMSHLEFQTSLHLDLLNNTYIREISAKSKTAPVQSHTAHHLVRTRPGSLQGGRNNEGRRYRGACRQCPNVLGGARCTFRMTAWYCLECKVPLHPECSAAFHSPTDFCLPKPVKKYSIFANQELREHRQSES
jgi:hypothetical protein